MRQVNRQVATSHTVSVPAPVGGLNARDALADMSPLDAIKMENFFPLPSEIQTRNGYINWATGLPAWVESLMVYTGATSANLIAASGTAFYDATATGAIGSAVVTGLTNARWQSTNLSNAGGHFMYCVNGVDTPYLFDGTNWTSITAMSSPAITGVTTTLLMDVALYKNRLWFVEKGSFRVWYLPTNSIGGAAQSIDFGPLFKLGGYLVTMTSWSIDNAGGIDDYAAFISSEGEVAIYRGYDPSSVATWALAALFRIGRPIGQRCVARIGSDVIVVCADGFFPLSKALLTNRDQLQNALSNKILGLVNGDVQKYSGNFGWQPILHPVGNKFIINIPHVENSIQYQYVMNVISGAWCTFKGWNAACFATLGNTLYFGGNAIVAQADVGSSDNGVAIVADVKPAFNYFKTPGVNKKFLMVRPTIKCDGIISASISMNVDFSDIFPTEAPDFTGNSGSAWNTSPWNVTPWGGTGQIQNQWQSVGGIGFCGAMRMRVASSTFPVAWQATAYVYEMGGTL